MRYFIRSSAAISPQQSFGRAGLAEEIILPQTNRFSANEPDYKNLIDPKLIRRMSRIIRMGVAAATQCLSDAQVQQPDAIITGTAYGCLEDTGVFINRMIGQDEEMLSPTAFIQSTHNTVAAQIALLLHCHEYNNTFVHRGFSFEHALLDASMLIAEKNDAQVLVGAVDEITEYSHTILNRLGLLKKEIGPSGVLEIQDRGTINGEGAAFFLLSGQQQASDIAAIDGFKTVYKPRDKNELAGLLNRFLADCNVSAAEIDLLITGRNGNPEDEKIFDSIQDEIFPGVQADTYKNLCGEYPTSVSFAVWLAATKINSIQARGPEPNRSVKKIMIWNHYLGIHHSFILLSAC